MMTVRFPSGVSVQYNGAYFSRRNGDGSTTLYTKENSDWIATVPTCGCIVEGTPPCRVYDATAGDRAEQVLQNLEGLPNSTLRQLKRRLGKWRSRTGEWKP